MLPIILETYRTFDEHYSVAERLIDWRFGQQDIGSPILNVSEVEYFFLSCIRLYCKDACAKAWFGQISNSIFLYTVVFGKVILLT